LHFIAVTFRERIEGAFTKAQPRRAITYKKPLSLMETSLVFLAKCAICILLVCVALQWRADHAPVAPKSAAVRASAPQHAAGFVQDAIEKASALIRAGGDAIAGAARDKCLAAPRDCLSAAQRVQSAAGRAQ